jgi:GNAT superfamily N-acetyltransferase
MTIERATPNDSGILTDLTKKSKAYWGYSNEQIELWSESLTITKSYIETKDVFKLVLDNKIIGYYSFFTVDEDTLKLDNFFILPEYIGKGYGRELMNDFFDQVKKRNIKKIMVDSEPYAEKFYLKFGFIKIGQMETSIKDRYLPIMELRIPAA